VPLKNSFLQVKTKIYGTTLYLKKKVMKGVTYIPTFMFTYVTKDLLEMGLAVEGKMLNESGISNYQ